MPLVLSDQVPTDSRMREWWYNSLDAAVTLEIHEVLARANAGTGVYAFERAMQGPALEMMLTGFRVDPIWKSASITRLEKEEGRAQEVLDKLAYAVWKRPLNPRSPDQLKDFLYNEMGLPVQHKNVKGERKVSTDRECLEKLDDYYQARPFIQLIFASRDARKKLSTLRTGVDPDGRMRCTYNVCGTESGRWASSKNVFGRGGNMQNITEELRRAFVADPGHILVYVDGEQAESRAVGFIHGRVFDDWRYLDACEEGDLHTFVTRNTWTHLKWSDDPKENRAIADTPFYRHFTYRDMAKRGGHGTNYVGTPWTMAKHLKVPKQLIEEFQKGYFATFPAMRKWHLWVAQQLMLHQSITTFVGRERTFFGRPNDDATHREAVAYEPQSVVGDLVNEGGYRIWRQFPEATCLAQIHDAYLFQIPDNRLDLVDRMRDAFAIPVTTRGRTMLIPAEAKVGWNWAGVDSKDPKTGEYRFYKDGNPDGLAKWKGSDTRTRREDPSTPLLDRVLH